MWKPDSLWTWSFLLITIVQGIAVIGLEAYAFAVFEQSLDPQATTDTNTDAPNNRIAGIDPPKRFVFTKTVPTFLTLYIFAVLYQIVLTIDALRMRNVIQVIGLVILNFLLMMYGALQQVQFTDALGQLMGVINNQKVTYLEPIETAVPCIIAAGCLLLGFVAWKLYQEFAWTIYKSISADLRMKHRYLTYQVYIALLKFDFFFFLGYTIQFLVVIQSTYAGDPEFPLTVAALPVTIIILLLAAFFVRREHLVGTLFVILIYFAALAYFIFKLVRIWYGQKRKYYQAIAKPLSAFAAIDIALIIVTIGVAILCTLNFNKGLKPHLLGESAARKNEVEEGKAYQPNEMANLNYSASQMASRMTIE